MCVFIFRQKHDKSFDNGLAAWVLSLTSTFIVKAFRPGSMMACMKHASMCVDIQRVRCPCVGVCMHV